MAEKTVEIRLELEKCINDEQEKMQSNLLFTTVSLNKQGNNNVVTNQIQKPVLVIEVNVGQLQATKQDKVNAEMELRLKKCVQHHQEITRYLFYVIVRWANAISVLRASKYRVKFRSFETMLCSFNLLVLKTVVINTNLIFASLLEY